MIASPKLEGTAIKIFTEPIDLNPINETVTLSPRLIVPTAIRFAGGKDPEIKVKVKVIKIEPEPEPKPLQEKSEILPREVMQEGVKTTPVKSNSQIRK